MNRSDLLGWTLAELAFAVLFALLAILLPTYKIAADRNKMLETEAKKMASSATEIEKLKAENATLHTAIEAARKNLRSTALPACAELDKNSEPLFAATIISDDTFLIDGGQYSMPMIVQKYGAQIASAKSRGCVDRVRLYYRANLNARDYDEGFKKIRQYFYPIFLGER